MVSVGAGGAWGVCVWMMDDLSVGEAEPQTVMIDAIYLNAYRTASSLRVKRRMPTVWLTSPKVVRI